MAGFLTNIAYLGASEAMMNQDNYAVSQEQKCLGELSQLNGGISMNRLKT